MLAVPHPQTSAPLNEIRKKKVISHRGLSSIFPENTIEAINAGLYSSDFVEIDVHLTKDNQIVVFHDRTLSRVTNISMHPEHLMLKKEEIIDDYAEKKIDWWIRDFTLEELRQLKVHQPVSYRPQFEGITFKISTLEEIIVECLKIKTKSIHKDILKSGLLIEIKEEVAGTVSPRDHLLCRKIVELLKKFDLSTNEACYAQNFPVVLQSFNIPLLSLLQECTNSQVQLYDKEIEITEEMLLRNYRENVIGIAITQRNLLDLNGCAENRVGHICAKLNYELYYWVIRDDDALNIPFQCSTYDEVYKKLHDLGVNGFITEFPDKCRGIFNLMTPIYFKGNSEIQITTCEEEENREVRKGSESNTVSTNTSFLAELTEKSELI